MSTTHPPARRRGTAQTLSSLLLASVLGMAANTIHGAFSHVAVKDRDAPKAKSRPENRKESSTDSPADVPPQGWWAILRRTFSEVGADRVLAVAGGVTFYALLSLFPAITVLVSLYGLFADPQSISQHMQTLASFLPEGAISIIGEQVRRISQGDPSQLGLAAIVGVLIALWSANSGVKAMMDALNIAYDTEERRGFFKLNLVSLGFTFSAILGVIAMFTAVAIVPLILQWVMLGPIVDVLLWAGRWPLVFIVILLALAVLYRYGPSRPNVRWRWITPGSLLATIGLVALSMLFSWYAANFGRFNETYGSLGAVIGFMTWMWFSTIIILVGAELNAEVEAQVRGGRASHPASSS